MSNATLTSGPVGWFGKLPAFGDFVQRHLPASFVCGWDAWLQAGMAAASMQQGEQWKDIYLRFPIWYFLRSVNLEDAKAPARSLWAGMLVPSNDRVGRLFPFTIAFQVPAELFLQLDFSRLEDQLEQLETSVLDVLATDDVEAFEQALAGVAPIAADLPSRPLHAIAPAALQQHLGAQALLERLHDSTLFWAPDAGPAEPLILAAEPLQAEDFCRLAYPLATPLTVTVMAG